MIGFYLKMDLNKMFVKDAFEKSTLNHLIKIIKTNHTAAKISEKPNALSLVAGVMKFANLIKKYFSITMNQYKKSMNMQRTIKSGSIPETKPKKEGRRISKGVITMILEKLLENSNISEGSKKRVAKSKNVVFEEGYSNSGVNKHA